MENAYLRYEKIYLIKKSILRVCHYDKTTPQN